MSAIGQPVISPPMIKLGGVLGSNTPVTATATLSFNIAIAGNSDIRTSIRYQAPSANWLKVTPSGNTTPVPLSFSADPSALPEGTHTAQVLVYVGQYGAPATATVSFFVGPSSGNPAGLAVNPSSLTFMLKASTEPQTLKISNTVGTSGSVTFTASTSTHSWLAVTQSGLTAPGTVKVQVSPTGLSPGVYTAAVMITTSAGKTTVAPVTMVVPSQASGSVITLTPAQRTLTFNFQSNSSSNPTQTIYISTDSSQYLYFTASTSTSWIGISPAAWIPAKSTATCFAPGLFYVQVDPTGLTPGAYHGSITLAAPGVTSVELPVNLNISSIPVLNTNPSFVTLDSASDLLTTSLSITASTAFFFTASVSGNTPWLKISSNAGVASEDPISLVVAATTTGLPAGTYNGSVTISGPGGQPTLTVPVQLKVSGATAANTVRLSPETIEFAAVSGDGLLPQFVNIGSDLNAADEFSVSASADGGWLNAVWLTSPSGFIRVTVNTAGGPGIYSGTITATSLKTGDVASAVVSLKNSARTFTVTPTTLAFRQSAPGAAIAPQELQVASNRASAFQVVSQPDWATVRAPAGLTTPATLVVSVNSAGMQPGQYDGVLRLSGPIDVAVPLSLLLPEPAPPVASPNAVTFEYDLGGPPPISQSVSISNPTGSVRFSAQVSTASGIDWLQADPSSGMTPGAIFLKINVARLTPGQHTGSLAIRVESTPVKTLTVPVTLTVRGSAVQIQMVLNKATMQPTALSPGLLVTLIGLGLGPATPVSARPSAAGSYETQLGGVQLRFDGVAAPLLYVSSERLDAIVPYSIYGRATVQIQEQNSQGYSIPIESKTVDAAPGIFTQAQNGRGPAAALNADFTVNSALNPARRGSVIVVYMTGEGQTDPPGQDGRVISTDVRRPLLPVTATIGGVPAEVQYAGSAPEAVSGICQVNVRIPEGVDPGAQSLEIRVGGIPSQRAVTIEIQ